MSPSPLGVLLFVSAGRRLFGGVARNVPALQLQPQLAAPQATQAPPVWKGSQVNWSGVAHDMRGLGAEGSQSLAKLRKQQFT